MVVGLVGLVMMIPLILRNEEQDRIERDQSVEERGNFVSLSVRPFLRGSSGYWRLLFSSPVQDRST